MAHRLLLIGATGHIGGAVLDELIRSRPGISITAVVRKHEDRATLEARYPGVEVVVGSLEETELLRELASEAAVIINCAPDAMVYADGIQALVAGLASREPRSTAFYIHTSGAALIWDAPTGSANGRTWDDVDDIADIVAQPHDASHAASDALVRSLTSSDPGKGPLAAIVAPSFVTGVSPSSQHPTPLVYPDWSYVLRRLGHPFIVGAGQNRMAFVDVRDLARLYSALAGNALARLRDEAATEAAPDVAVWGPEAYYFGASIELSMRDFLEEHFVPALRDGADFAIAGETREVPIDRVVELVLERLGGAAGAELWSRHIAEAFGVNTRVRGTRAEKALGFVWGQGDAGIAEAAALFLKRAG